MPNQPIVTTVRPQIVISIDKKEVLSGKPQGMLNELLDFAGSVQDLYRDLAQSINLISKYFCGSPRTCSGSPSGALVPYYLGEEVLDTTNTVWYKSTGDSTIDWVALN